jgi:tetratricopeptide (TPR) repeat protein
MFAMAPKSSQQLMIDAEGMMVKGETYSAQKALLEVLDRGAGDFQEDAEFLLVKIRMKKLMSWAKDRPLLANQTAKGSTKDFLKAFDYEELQRYDDALTCYNKILRQVSAEPLEGRHLYLAALQRKKALLELLSNQAGQSESLPGVPSPIRFQPELPSSGEKSLFPPIEENSMRKASETATG